MKKKAFGLAVVFIVAVALWLVSFSSSKEKDLAESKVVMIEAATEAEWEAAITEAVVAYEVELEAAITEAELEAAITEAELKAAIAEAELKGVIIEDFFADRVTRIANNLSNDLVKDEVINGWVKDEVINGWVKNEVINALVWPVEDEFSERARKLNRELFVKKFVSKLSTATAAYNRLNELWYQKPETVVYRFDLSSPSGPSLAASLEGETISVELPVTPYMSVELTGSAGLEIEPEGKIKKRVSDVSSTSWLWRVKAVDVGEQFLTLTTYVHFSRDGESEPYSVRTYEDEIKVNVKLVDHLMATVSKIQPVLAVFVAVITALVGAYGWLMQKEWRTKRKPFVSKIKGIYRSNKKL